MAGIVLFVLAIGCDSADSGGSRRPTTKAMLVQVASQLDIFKLDHGEYPDALEDLIKPPKWVNSDKYPPQGYLKDYPTDGWGNRIVYRPGKGPKSYTLLSYGADGREGGTGPDADIQH